MHMLFNMLTAAMPFRPRHLTDHLTCLQQSFALHSKSQYLEIFAALLEEVHNHFSNPLRPLMLKAMGWRPEVARGRDALAIHDQLMGAKLKAQLASPPPEYTITGESGLLGCALSICGHLSAQS